MTRCWICFDTQLAVRLNAGNAALIALKRESGPPDHIDVTLTCVHGAELHHASFPGTGSDDWEWCLTRLPEPHAPMTV